MPAFDVSVDGALDTYTKLLAAITEETDGRADSSSLARFVRNAEAEIARFLKRNPVRPMKARETVTISGEYYPLTFGVVRPISLELTIADKIERLPYVSEEYLSQVQSESVPAYPAFFTRPTDAELRIWPTATATYSGTLFYYEPLAQLTAANLSNWLLAEHPDVYLSGSLYYAYRYMPDIEKAAAMKAIFEQALAEVVEAYPEPANEMTLKVDPAIHKLGRTYGQWLT